MSDKVEIVGRTAKVDARDSLDPDGSAVDYRWKLRRAPDTSAATFYADDGSTSAANQFDHTDIDATITPGDFLLFEGVGYEILIVTPGFNVTVDGTPFTVGATDVMARIFRSSSINYSNESIATILIDALGQYLIQLEVFDGLAWSDPTDILIDGREWDSILGEAISGEFMWNYLSDVYSAVNEKEYITEFFAGITQVAAANVSKALQVETGVSLRDIQPYFHYRWLQLDNVVKETSFTDQTFTPAYGEVAYQSVAPNPVPAVGDTLQVRVYTGEDVYVDVTHTFDLSSGVIAANAVAELNALFSSLSYPLTAGLLSHNGNDFYTLKGDVAFEIIGGTADQKMFRVGQTNWLLGDVGQKLDRALFWIHSTAVTGKLEGWTLRDFNLQGHFMVTRGSSYKILSAETEATDDLPYQRLVLAQDLPNLNPVVDFHNWAIPGFFTSQGVEFEDELVYNADLAHLTLAYGNSEEEVETRVVGVYGNRLGVMTSYPTNPYYDAVLFAKVRRYSYHPVDEKARRIPRLQEIINNPDEILQENVEYLLDSFRGRSCVIYDYFTTKDWVSGGVVVPISIEDKITEQLWAEQVVVSNKEIVSDNFGVRVYFDQETYEDLDEVEFLSSVRGLWFVFSRGKTIENITRGLYIFFALPIAEQDGTIEQIATDGDSTYGRIYVRDYSEDGTGDLRTYLYKKSLGLAYNPQTGLPFGVGDTVEQFTPLVQGIDVKDWIKDPTWPGGFVGANHFMDADFMEVQKYHRFLVEIDSEAYTAEYLDSALRFIEQWRPRYLLPIVVVFHKVEDEIIIEEDILWELDLKFIDVFCQVTPYILDMGHLLDTGWVLDEQQFCPTDIIDVMFEWNPAVPPPTATLDSIFFLDGKGPAWTLDDTSWAAVPFPYTTGWVTIYER